MNEDILLVDDDRAIRQELGGYLEDLGYGVRVAASVAEYRKSVNERVPKLLLLDLKLTKDKEDEGLEILKEFLSENPLTPVVMISGGADIEKAVRAVKEGAYDFIKKPPEVEHLLLTIRRAIETAELRRENSVFRRLNHPEDDLIGSSLALTRLRAAIERVAPRLSRVLITGPAGSGKEFVARRIHQLSGRSKGPFVVINAATLSPESVEHVLFGTEDNTQNLFQGRDAGVFERAHQGTLLLDNVEDMPFETQGKMHQFLETAKFKRMGRTTPVQADLRVLATTSKNLDAEVKNGRFRSELYYRLKVVSLNIPPLSSRREDIPDLCNHFLERFSIQPGFRRRSLTDDALRVLQSADWQGNVRQLRNIIESLLIMTPHEGDGSITEQMVCDELQGDLAPVTGSELMNNLLKLRMKDARAHFERSYLEAQLSLHGFNISKTAELIGMDRAALHRKCNTLGIATSGDNET